MPAKTTDLRFDFLGKKTRDVEDPYMTLHSRGWEYRVLKANHVNAAKPGASWFCAVKSPYTFGSFDYGDTYVRDVFTGGVTYATGPGGRELTNDEMETLEALVSHFANTEDPLKGWF